MHVTRTLIVGLVAGLLCASAAPVAAQKTVVLAPLATLGTEAKSKDTKAIEDSLVAGLEASGFKVQAGSDVLRAIKKAKKPALRTCDGNVACLVELGKLVSTDYVVFGEVGGLGDVQIVYLKAVDTSSGKELSSTTLEVGGSKQLAAESIAAGFRLLAPGRYVGRLVLKVDTDDAVIYVDGEKVAKSPSAPIDLSVGTHAVRVTHPEYRDFVRFVDLDFDANSDVEVNLQRFPIVSSAMVGHGAGNGTSAPIDGGVIDGGVEPTPWYRTWWATASFAAGIVITSAIIVAIIADGIDADREKIVGDGRPSDGAGAPAIPLFSW